MTDEEEDWFEAALKEGAEIDGIDTDSVDDGSAGDDNGDPLFEDDFAEAMADTSVASDTDIPTGPSLDEPIDSAIPRIDLGITGLDEMIQGGVPRRSLMVAIGGPGTGKTTLAQQFIQHGLEHGERCVYLSLEESKNKQLRSAAEKGWEYEHHLEAGNLAIVDLDPVEMATRLSSIKAEFPQIIGEFGAERVVLDSVSLLELMFDEPARRRNQIYDFANSLKQAGVTTLMTSEASGDTPYNSRYGMVEYLTDAVFILRHVRESGGPETRLAIEILKIRDANHSREAKPFAITDAGIEVYQQANIF